jgi:hypothetical protein
MLCISLLLCYEPPRQDAKVESKGLRGEQEVLINRVLDRQSAVDNMN